MTSERRAQLEAELAKVRARLESLETELHKIIEEEQQEAIENHLEEYFSAVETTFIGLRTLLANIFTEVDVEKKAGEGDLEDKS